MPDKSTRELIEAIRLQRGGLLDQALNFLKAAADGDDPTVLAEALRHQADIHRTRCDWDTALALARRSEEVAASAGLNKLEAEALNARAAVHLEREELDAAGRLLHRMLDLTSDPRIQGIALQNLGVLAGQLGDLEQARSRFGESHERFRRAEYLRGMATSMINTGRVALLKGDDEGAEELCSQAEILARRLGDLELVALASLNLGDALVRRGRLEQAEAHLVGALGYFSRAGNAWRQTECYRLLGEMHAAAGDQEGALACFRQGLTFAEECETPNEIELLGRRVEELATASEALPAGEGAARPPEL